MRFVFCGGLDCPDWVLAAVTVLSRLSPTALRLIAGEATARHMPHNNSSAYG
jgi:hypothetical protein